MTVFLLQFAYLWAIGFCLYTLGWLFLRADRNRTTVSLMFCQFLIIVWCVPQLFLSLGQSREIKYLLYGISYLGISFIGASWLIFSFYYCQKPIRTWAKLLLFGISLFDYAMFWTNESHNLFYRMFAIKQVIYGPVFYVHMLFTYSCVLLGIGVVLKNFYQKQVPAVHMLAITLSAAVPLGFNLLYLSGIVKTGFDLTPPAFALSSFFMLLAVFRYDFLDIHVLAFERIFSAISEGVVVYNKRGIVTYCNQAAENWLGVRRGHDGRALYRSLLERAREQENQKGSFSGTVKERGEEEEKELEEKEQKERDNDVLTLEGGEKLRLKHYPLRNKRGEETAQILLFTDVGEYFELLRQSRELGVSEQRLAIEQERNRIAQEVHDTTGHTLTMIQSLIKLIRISYGENRRREELCGENQHGEELYGENQRGEELYGKNQHGEGSYRENQPGKDADTVEDYLNQAQELASQGIRELRWSINHLRWGNENKLVTEGVYQLTGQVKEIEVEVLLQGEDGPAYSHLSAVIYRCLREAITNCLKYAHASHMDVIVKFAEKELSLYVFDDGQGCASIQENHGIRGIRERVEKAGGQVRFLSAQGEGFQMYVKLPL